MITENTRAIAETYLEAKEAVAHGLYIRLEDFYMKELEYDYVGAIHAILKGGLAEAIMIQEREKEL